MTMTMTKTMNFLKPITCATLLAATLAGCGGSYEEDLLDQAQAYDNRVARVNAMTPSGPKVVDKTTGSANFTGNALIVAGSEYDRTVLVGDANVRVNFDNQNAINGSITNVGGVAGANEYISGSGSIDQYSGSVNLNNGTIGSGNQFSVDYTGTLRGNGDTINMDGTMYGNFFGNPNIRALDARGLDPALVNGYYEYVGVRVVAERD